MDKRFSTPDLSLDYILGRISNIENVLACLLPKIEEINAVIAEFERNNDE